MWLFTFFVEGSAALWVKTNVFCPPDVQKIVGVTTGVVPEVSYLVAVANHIGL